MLKKRISVIVSKLSISGFLPSAIGEGRLVEGELTTSLGRTPFHLVGPFSPNDHTFNFFITEALRGAAEVPGFSQLLPQGRVHNDAAKTRAFFDVYGKAWKQGKQLLQEEITPGKGFILATDATNFPGNEGHFVIWENQLLPFLKGANIPSGPQPILAIDRQGSLRFQTVDLDQPDQISRIWKGFFVPQVVHNGQQIELLDPMPGTKTQLISAFRGSPVHLFRAEHDSKGAPTKIQANINRILLDWLRQPESYRSELTDLLAGEKIPWRFQGESPILRSLERAVYNHTYWAQSERGSLWLVKTYPDRQRNAGLRLEDTAEFFQLLGYRFNGPISFQNVYIGTNGKDVQIIDKRQGLITSCFGHDLELGFGPRGMNRGVGSYVGIYNKVLSN